MSSDLLSFIALACFILGAAAAIAGFWVESLKRSGWQFFFAGAGALFKTIAIGAACKSNDSHFFNSNAEIFGLMAWSLSLSYLLALAVSKARSLGALVLPLVVVLLAVSLFSGTAQKQLDVPNTPLFAVHILSAFLGYGLFLTACGASILYLEQARLLKRKMFGMLFQDLPSLERLERLEMLCSRLGLLLFTVALVVGVVLFSKLGQSLWVNPKFLSAFVTWLVFGALVTGRALTWLRGRTAAKCVLAGAVLVMLTFALGHPIARTAGGGDWKSKEKIAIEVGLKGPQVPKGPKGLKGPQEEAV